jgi:hypothetical protein
VSVIYSLFAVAFSACSGDDESISDSKSGEIAVSTNFDSVFDVETRGEGSIYKEHILAGGQELPLSIVRLDQNETDGSYPSSYTATNVDGVGQAPRKGRLRRNNLDILMSFVGIEYYLSHPLHDKTKLIGWYPTVGNGSTWSVDASGTATVSFDVNGDTDIIMSNLDLVEVSQPPPNPTTTTTMTFDHLLTRFRVRVYTYDPDVAGLYGGVKSISLTGKKQTCVATLPDATTSDKAIVVFNGNDNLPIIRRNPVSNSVIEYNNGVLPVLYYESGQKVTDSALAGYAMVAPETKVVPETNKVDLVVETEKGSTTTYTVSIAAPTGGFAAGKSYTLDLEFRTDIKLGIVIKTWVDDGNVEIDKTYN